MPPLHRYRRALLLFLVLGQPIILLVLYVHEGFVILALAHLFFWSWRAKSVRCDRCDTPLAPPVGASAAALIHSLQDKTCRHCGATLD
ncbi:hypothetical protein [Roseateles sp. L2-2]|uniref:hypothetical protein n=1 Tax=Roseateles TaxID=93681 RepID=UPI003D35F5AF